MNIIDNMINELTKTKNNIDRKLGLLLVLQALKKGNTKSITIEPDVHVGCYTLDIETGEGKRLQANINDNETKALITALGGTLEQIIQPN